MTEILEVDLGESCKEACSRRLKPVYNIYIYIYIYTYIYAVAQWLSCCATNRKVAGSIPDGVIGIFH